MVLSPLTELEQAPWRYLGANCPPSALCRWGPSCGVQQRPLLLPLASADGPSLPAQVGGLTSRPINPGGTGGCTTQDGPCEGQSIPAEGNAGGRTGTRAAQAGLLQETSQSCVGVGTGHPKGPGDHGVPPRGSHEQGEGPPQQMEERSPFPSCSFGGGHSGHATGLSGVSAAWGAAGPPGTASRSPGRLLHT